MATTSFEQRFYVSKEKREEFNRVINAPQKKPDRTFESKYLTGNDLKKYVKDAMNNK